MLVGGGFHDTWMAPVQDIGDGNCDMCLACSSLQRNEVQNDESVMSAKKKRGSPLHLELAIKRTGAAWATMVTQHE